MTDVTIYKLATVTIRLVAGQYVVVAPAGTTIQALNKNPPIDQTAQVAALTAQVAQLTADLDACITASHTPPTIANFMAVPANLPVGGGSVTISADIHRADSISLDLDGAAVPLPSGLPASITVT